ncbi:MAG: CoB--CoM heterodisulfide reductase iron-sulfur subunit B family protein [candidate division WOR-3 bacterium]
MKEFPYYPGCTLYTKAKALDLSLRLISEKLGFRLKELTTWNCCGAIYNEVENDITAHIAPLRNLIQAKKEGGDKLVTTCAACYNVLKRSQSFVFLENNPEIKKRVSAYLEDEIGDYKGDIEILHYLELLKQEIGFERLKNGKKLNGLKVGCYYGCLLIRPPKVLKFPLGIMEELFSLLGAEIVESPFREYCCGGYTLLISKEGTRECVAKILNSFSDAEVIITSCPLCLYNLDKFQDGPNRPILYFSQLLGLLFDLKEEVLNFQNHFVDPRPILEKRGLYGKV